MERILTRVLLSCGASVSIACAGDGRLRTPLPARIAPCAFDRERQEIACGSDRIAHVTCHRPSTPVAGACRGLSVEYFYDGAVVWLKKGGQGGEHAADEGRPQYDVAGAYDVAVATDGSRIWFQPISSVFSAREWKSYAIFDGALSDVAHENEWRLWLAIRDHRAVWLADKPPEDDYVWGIR